MTPNKLTLKAAINALKAKQLSHQELYDAVDKAVSENNELNIFLSIDAEATKEAEKKLSTPLAGIPLAVKDNFCTQKLPTTGSAKLLDGFRPQFESTVTKKLQEAGSVIYGKTNLDAWAHGSSTETSEYGRTLNPRNPEHLPGGSSGGSAASIASDTAIASIGTETAGSIRQPASWCGVVGLKPTYGRCSRYGVLAMASSLDCPGPITKTVEDAAIMLNHMAGHDPKDGTSTEKEVHDFTATIDSPVKGLKIGVVYTDIDGLGDTAKLFEKEVEVLSELGAEVEKVDALDPHYAISVYTILQRGEVSSNLARFDDVRYPAGRDTFGDEAKRRIMLGTHSLSKGYADQYYTLAQKVRQLYVHDFAKLFETFDVLVSPSTPSFAKKIGATEGSAMFGELEDMLQEPSTIAGLPGITVPCYQDKKTNLFLGMNISAPMWREDLCIQVGDAFEKATEWNTWRNQS